MLTMLTMLTNKLIISDDYVDLLELANTIVRRMAAFLRLEIGGDMA